MKRWTEWDEELGSFLPTSEFSWCSKWDWINRIGELEDLCEQYEKDKERAEDDLK